MIKQAVCVHQIGATLLPTPWKLGAIKLTPKDLRRARSNAAVVYSEFVTSAINETLVFDKHTLKAQILQCLDAPYYYQ